MLFFTMSNTESGAGAVRPAAFTGAAQPESAGAAASQDDDTQNHALPDSPFGGAYGTRFPAAASSYRIATPERYTVKCV